MQSDFAGTAILLEGEFPNRDLRGKSFAGADLPGRDFGGASLEKANFTGANLDGVNLSRAKLDGACFRNASLRGANLSDASGLRSNQFPGADLTGAKLPEIVGKFETLAVIKDASDQAKTLFIALIAACAFSWLTIGATRDVSLLSNSSTTALPIINVPLPIDDFYMVAPVLLLIAFLYFHLSLQRLWEQLADLPAFFPDGNAADKRVYPWLLSGLMRSKTDRLRRDPRAMGKSQTAVSALLAYALAPLTLIGFWGRYLTAHDWIGTAFHAGLIVLAAALAVAFWRQLGMTFEGGAFYPTIWNWSFLGALLALAPMLGNGIKLVLQGARKSMSDVEPARLALPPVTQIVMWVFIVLILAVAGEIAIRHRGLGRPLKHGGAAGALVALLVLVSVGSIEAVEPNLASDSFRTEGISDWDPRRWIPRLTSFFSHGPIATLTEADVSTKPANWGEKENLDSVKGANLRGRNLRYVHAERAFLAGADLRGANLRYARFEWADLRNADFRGADLTGAVFADAKMDGAIFLNADVFRADFTDTTGLTGVQAFTAKNSQLAWWPERVGEEESKFSHVKEGTQAERAKKLPTRDFKGCELSGHDVSDFVISVVAGADFRGARVSSNKVEASDIVLAQWDPNMAKSLALPPDHSTWLQSRDLTPVAYSIVLKRRAFTLELSEFRLDGLDLAEVDFVGSTLVRATFRRALLQGARFENVDVAFADFTQALGLKSEQIRVARNWQLSKYDPGLLSQLGLPRDHNERVDRRDFTNYGHLNLKLSGNEGKPLNFDGDLSGSDFRGFRGALSVRGSNLDKTNVAGIRLDIASVEQVMKATNWQLARFPQPLPGMPERLVPGTDFPKAEVQGADLHGMDLREATFKGAKFYGTDLREAKFEGSDLTDAEFALADVRWTDFRGAKNLTLENIREARFWRSAYYDDDLRKKLGLPDSHNQIVRRLETFLKDAP